MYEKRHEALAPAALFMRRIVRHTAVAAALVACSLAIGMAGYHGLEGLPWIDAFVNSAMLLGGMGPVDAPKTPGGKFFAGCYALYAGLVFIVSAALILTPILHRVLHHFHWDDKA